MVPLQALLQVCCLEGARDLIPQRGDLLQLQVGVYYLVVSGIRGRRLAVLLVPLEMVLVSIQLL